MFPSHLTHSNLPSATCSGSRWTAVIVQSGPFFTFYLSPFLPRMIEFRNSLLTGPHVGSVIKFLGPCRFSLAPKGKSLVYAAATGSSVGWVEGFLSHALTL
jgi:hypothetical protein